MKPRSSDTQQSSSSDAGRQFAWEIARASSSEVGDLLPVRRMASRPLSDLRRPSRNSAFSPAAAEAHLVQGFTEKVADLLHIAGRGDQLEAAQILALRDAVDHVLVVDTAVVLRRVEVLDAGVSDPG